MEWILALHEGDGDEAGARWLCVGLLGLGSGRVEFGWTRGSPPGYVNLFTNAYYI
jgi:hypothetical protein